MDNRAQKEIDLAVTELSKENDCVQVFLSKYSESENGSIENVPSGIGNIFARLGQVDSWLEKIQERQPNKQEAIIIADVKKYYDAGQFFLARQKNGRWIYRFFGFGNIYLRKMQCQIWSDMVYNILSDNDEDE